MSDRVLWMLFCGWLFGVTLGAIGMCGIIWELLK